MIFLGRQSCCPHTVETVLYFSFQSISLLYSFHDIIPWLGLLVQCWIFIIDQYYLEANIFSCCSYYKLVVFLIRLLIWWIMLFDSLILNQPCNPRRNSPSSITMYYSFICWYRFDWLIFDWETCLHGHEEYWFAVFSLFCFSTFVWCGCPCYSSQPLIKRLRKCRVSYFLKEMLRNWHYFYLSCLGPELSFLEGFREELGMFR